MKLSTKGRYGTRAMLELAMRQETGPVNVKEIAEKQDISPRYLEHLMARLASRGLVRPVRGRGGGFVLSRPPSEITLADIVEALEGPISVVECVEDPAACDRYSTCATREIWEGVSQSITRYLGEMTLEELYQRQQEKDETKTAMYYI